MGYRKFLLLALLLSMAGFCNAGGYGSAPGEDEECDEDVPAAKTNEDGTSFAEQ